MGCVKDALAWRYAVGGWRSASLEVGGRGQRERSRRSEVRSQPPSPDGFGAPRRSEDSGQIQSDAAMRRYGDAARKGKKRDRIRRISMG